MDEQTQQQTVVYQKKPHPDQFVQKKQTGPQISNTEWWLIIGGLFVMDVIQVGLDLLFGSGIALNRFLDIFVGMTFALYLVIRKQMDSKRFWSLVATFVGEEIPGVDVLPFWCLDGYYAMSVYKNNQALQEIAEQENFMKEFVKKTQKNN